MWRTVHAYLQIWSEVDKEEMRLLERALKNQVGAASERQGRIACNKFLIVDAQSVKNVDTAGRKGYDAGKRVSD